MKLNLPKDHHDKLAALSVGLGLTAIVAFGGVHLSFLPVFAFVTVTMLVLMALWGEGASIGFGWFMAWVLLACVQLIPIGDNVIHLLSPTLAEWFQASAQLGDVRSATISVEPARTWQSLAWILNYIAFFVVSFYVFSVRDLQERALKLFTWIGAGLSALAIVQILTGVSVVSPWLSSSEKGFAFFLNTNHGVVFVLALLPAAITSFLYASPGQKPYFAGCIFLTVAAVMLTSSRFAFIALPTVLVATFVLHLFLSADRKQFLRRHGLVSGFLVAAVVAYAAIILGKQGVVEKTQSLSHSAVTTDLRIALWQDAVTAFFESPIFGFGLGNFEIALRPLRTYPGFIRAEHAESEWLEVAVTGGVVGVILAMILLSKVIGSVKRSLQARDPFAAAAIGGLVVLFGAASVFFVFEVPALMMVAIVYLAMLFNQAQVAAPPVSVLSAKVSIMAFLVLIATVVGITKLRDYQQCLDLAGNKSVSADVAVLNLADAKTCLNNMPLQSEPYLDLARRSAKIGDADTMVAASEKALFFDPFSAEAHFLMGNALRSTGELALAEQHYSKSLQLLEQTNTVVKGRIYFALYKVALSRGKEVQAKQWLAKARQYLQPATNLQAQIDLALATSDLPGLIRLGRGAEALSADQLPLFFKKIYETGSLSDEEKRVITGWTLVHGDIGKRLVWLESHRDLLNFSVEQAPFLFLPVAMPKRLEGLKSPLKYEAVHIDGEVRSDVSEEVDRAVLRFKLDKDTSLGGAPRYDLIFSEVMTTESVEIEILVATEYRPRRQLDVVLASETRQWVVQNEEALPLGYNWYALTAEIYATPDNPVTIKRASFNTGGISGEYAYGGVTIKVPQLQTK